ncbi:MAG: YraN family protein [Bacteroidota bacterium]
MAHHNQIGNKGEDLAAGFLETKGYIVLDRNYRFQRAEVDIVAMRLEPAEVVFVEVKTRTDTSGEYPEAAVTEKKKQQMYKVADSYIYERQLRTVPIRFDIIAISMDNPEHPLIHHIEDAFRPFL